MQWLEFYCPVTITAMGALRAPKPPPTGGDQPIPACLAALLPGGRLQGRCLALSAAVDKYKPVTRRVAARLFLLHLSSRLGALRALKGRIPAVIIAGKKMLEDHRACACHCLTEAFCHPASIKKSHDSGRNP